MTRGGPGGRTDPERRTETRRRPRDADRDATGERAAPPRTKRRRASWSWTFPALTEWGLTERQQRILMRIGTGVAVLVAAVVLTVLVNRVAGLSNVPQAAAGDSLANDLALPDDYQAWPSLKQFAPIGDHKADSAPLTAQEIFGEKTLKNGKLVLKQLQRKADGDCSVAVWSDELAAKLAESGCTQVVRGLYRSADGKYVAQYTLFDLSGVAAADGLVQALTTLHRGGWVRPLTGDVFPAGGYTESSGHAMGHFAGLVWVGRADGAEPQPKDDFVALSLAVRGAEKAIFRRVVAASGSSATPSP
jgi:hypothetical protein